MYFFTKMMNTLYAIETGGGFDSTSMESMFEKIKITTEGCTLPFELVIFHICHSRSSSKCVASYVEMCTRDASNQNVESRISKKA